MISRIASFLAIVGCFLIGSVAHARDVRIGIVNSPTDAFVRTFLDRAAASEPPVKVDTTQFVDDSKVLDGLLSGSLDLGLVTFDTLAESKLFKLPQLGWLLIQPFQFNSAQELFDLEHTVLGDAALAEINQTKMFPLAFWNLGFVKITANRKINTIDDFAKLIVSGVKRPNEAHVLRALGASANCCENALRGDVNATVVWPTDSWVPSSTSSSLTLPLSLRLCRSE
jgi:TRAP-type C4-dicarboxylate transport system substrate-binding protein